MAQVPASKKAGRRRTEKADDLGQMRSPPVLVEFRITARKQMAAFENVPNL